MTYSSEIDSLRIFWLRLYGWRTRMRGFWFWPAMCAASMAPAEARVSESMTKNKTRAFSFARCSRAMRSGVHCETCCKWKQNSLSDGSGDAGGAGTHRIIKGNAELLKFRHGDVSAPRRGVAGAAEEHLRCFHLRLIARAIRHRRCVEHHLLLYPQRALRRE